MINPQLQRESPSNFVPWVSAPAAIPVLNVQCQHVWVFPIALGCLKNSFPGIRLLPASSLSGHIEVHVRIQQRNRMFKIYIAMQYNANSIIQYYILSHRKACATVVYYLIKLRCITFKWHYIISNCTISLLLLLLFHGIDTWNNTSIWITLFFYGVIDFLKMVWYMWTHINKSNAAVNLHQDV